ncbi:MAG: type II toxin-antitoxin system RelE/ParE family toxin [Bacteroidota bacterium]
MSTPVEWSKRAKATLDYYYDQIEAESPASANKVRKEIVTTTKTLSKNPNLYQTDENYPDNPGNIRRFF